MSSRPPTPQHRSTPISTTTTGHYGIPDPDAPGGIATYHQRVTPDGNHRLDATPPPSDHDTSHRYVDQLADAAAMLAANPPLSRALWVWHTGRCTYCGHRRLGTAVALHRGACAPCAATQPREDLDHLAAALRDVADQRAPRA